MGVGQKKPPSQARYQKISNITGFEHVIRKVRETLGVDPDNQTREILWDIRKRFQTAVWTITDVFDLPAQDQAFVENAILYGIEKASEMSHSPRVRIMIPQLDPVIARDLVDAVVSVTYPEPPDQWLSVTENGEPAGVRQIGKASSETRSAAAATVIRGPGVISQMIRNGNRIYLDVTDASAEDIKNAIPVVGKLKDELQISTPVLRTGAPATRDEDKAVEAALLHRIGESYVAIGHQLGWKVYEQDVFSGTCPTAVKYVKLGEEILGKLEIVGREIEGARMEE